MKRTLFLLIWTGFLTVQITYAQKMPAYKDSSRPVAARVKDLLRRMTLEEKAEQLQSQLTFLQRYSSRDFRVGHFRNIAHFMHTGTVDADPGACAAAINADTRQSIEASRWGIPVLQHGEALHGAQWGNATCFPQSIGIGASFDDSLYYEEGKAVAAELRAVGVRQVYAPVINISRDPRWGRTEETYGEDVCLTSRMGLAYTRALEENGVIATPKHFVDNYGDAGHDSYASNSSWRVLRETFLEPFRVCVQEGGAHSIMAAYNSVDGVPCSSNAVLLDAILRREWGFSGFVVSDYGGVLGVYEAHRTAGTYAEAQAQCLEAGLDVELHTGYRALDSLVKAGRLSEKVLNRSVRRVLTEKFRLGLFEHPYVDTTAANGIVRSAAHKALALEAARQSITLLKNANNILPLAAGSLHTLGVFGPAAQKLSLGDYAGPLGGWWGPDAVTPYQGLLQRLQNQAQLVVAQPGQSLAKQAQGCQVLLYFANIREGEGQDRSMLTLTTPAKSKAESQAHAVIVDKEGVSTPVTDQQKEIRELAATGIPLIVVLQNGAAIDMRYWMDSAAAILEAWYPGEQGGTAIAEALFGDLDPGGRLPFSWPRHAGQVPIYYNIKPSGRGYDYNDDDGKPLFPFGYGLSYTQFTYSNLVIPERLRKDDSLRVQVTVTNTGSRAGDEVVQLYSHQELASVVRPLLELKGFRRIHLLPGESRTVSLPLPYRSFGYWDKDLHFVVDPGVFKLSIRRDAATEILKGQVRVE